MSDKVTHALQRYEVWIIYFLNVAMEWKCLVLGGRNQGQFVLAEGNFIGEMLNNMCQF